MRLGDLTNHGISERILEIWRERQGDRLLPVQSRAVRQGLLDDRAEDAERGNMIVSAPTSSGKSFCAELATIKTLAAQGRAVWLFPLRSLAEEKYRLFNKTYGPLGVKCLIATGDHPENDRRFAEGDYHVALAIYEKLDLALTGQLDLLRNIGLVVVDEIQMISEPGRGAILERLLTKIVASGYRPRILALSAVLADQRIKPLADWLEATLVEENLRPRDLLRGIATGGEFTYRSYNDSQEGREPFARFDPFDQENGSVKALAQQIKADGGATLLFLKSRSDSVQLALRLAAALGRVSAEKALTRLAGEEQSCLLRSLTQALRHGVAFHNSDLSGSQREIVEQAFTEGEISVLCSTTTLSLGVNLPADTVYLETVKYASGTYGSRPNLVPISRAEFDNMTGRAGRLTGRAGRLTGRAGRLGHGEDRPGRAVVLAESVFDSEVLWEAYIAPTAVGNLRSAWASLPAKDWVLHMIVAGLVRNRDELAAVYGKTLGAALRGESDPAPNFDASVAELTSHGLIMISDDGALSPTPAGASIARAGLSVAEAEHYLKSLHAGGYPQSVFGWTCLALSSDIWSLPPGMLSWYEQADNLPVKMLYQRFDHSVEEAVCLLPADHRKAPLSYRAAASLKAGLLLDEWCRLAPVPELEGRYRMHLGQIQSLGRTAAHLVAALASLIRATDRESEQPSVLAQQAFSLRFGLPPQMEAIHRKLGHVLGRSDFIAFHKRGVENLQELTQLSDADIRLSVSDSDKLQQTKKILSTFEEEVDMQPAVLDTQTQLGRQPQLIEIDGSLEADRYLVKINGFPVRLTGKSFKYLTKLAWSRVNDGTGWIYKEDIEIGFNQARYLYRMKNEINAGFKSGWPVVENNRLGYYRLHIDPDKIKLNLENLRSHPDYELRSMFDIGTGALN